jgi:hypothetical protein
LVPLAVFWPCAVVTLNSRKLKIFNVQNGGKKFPPFFYVRCPAQSRPVAIMFAKPLLFQFLEAEHLRPLEFGHGSLAFSLRVNSRAVYDNWPGLLPARDRCGSGSRAPKFRGFPGDMPPKARFCNRVRFLFFLSVFFQSIHDGVCGFEPASKVF